MQSSCPSWETWTFEPGLPGYKNWLIPSLVVCHLSSHRLRVHKAAYAPWLWQGLEMVTWEGAALEDADPAIPPRATYTQVHILSGGYKQVLLLPSLCSASELHPSQP